MTIHEAAERLRSENTSELAVALAKVVGKWNERQGECIRQAWQTRNIYVKKRLMAESRTLESCVRDVTEAVNNLTRAT